MGTKDSVICWTKAHGDSRVQRCNFNGGGLSEIGPLIEVPDSLAIDEVNRKIYFTSVASEMSIGRMNFDGSNPETIVANREEVYGLAVDPHNGFLFWCDTDAHQKSSICRAGLDGSNITSIATNVYQPNGVCILRSWMKVYWTARRPDNYAYFIAMADYDGSNVQTLVQGPDAKVSNPQVDPTGQYLYAIADVGVVRFLPGINQRQTVVPVNIDGHEGAVAFDKYNDRMVWTETRARNLKTASTEGQNVTLLGSGLDNPGGVAVVLPQLQALASFDFSGATVQAQGGTFDGGPGMEPNTPNGGWMLGNHAGNSFSVTVPLTTAPAENTVLAFDHCTAAMWPQDGYSPINIQVNSTVAARNFDPAAAHKHSGDDPRGYVHDEFLVPQGTLVAGTNTITVTVQPLALTNYWIRLLQLLG